MKYIAIIVSLLITAMAWSQEHGPREDLKVGLVLSGGGAKGLAHIGVLKELEAAGVRVDYIGGTSMGAIIGALYASGYSATQLDSIFSEVDFDTLIKDDVPRRAKTFFEKEDSEKYALTLPFNDFELRLPSGISKGQNIYNLLSRLLKHVKDVENFDQLPIPFVCIATDAEKGKQVTFKNGYLPRVITASGALPSLFSPVIIDSTIYVDGGVVNNYPVDEVKAMGADIIIGVDVQDTLRTRENLKSALEVLVQINNYRTIEGMKRKRELTDIYISPRIDDFSVVSFHEGKQIIKAGEEATHAMYDELKAIAEQQSTHVRPPLKVNNRESIFIKYVEIKGNKEYSRSYILGKLKLQSPAEVSYKDFNEGINNLSVTGNFSGIDYQFVSYPGQPDVYKVVFNVRESNDRTSIRLAARYDKLYKSAALINLTRKRLFTNNDVASLDVIVGDNVRYNFEYYIDKGYYWSIGLNSRFLYFEKNIGLNFVDTEIAVPSDFQLNKIGLEYDDITNQLFFQTLFQRVFQLGLGMEHKWLRYLSETVGVDENGIPRTIFENTNYFSAYSYVNFDTLDDKYFPTSGWYFSADFHNYLFAEGLNSDFNPFSIAKAKAGYAYSFTDYLSIYVTSEGGAKIGHKETRSLDFFLGGYGFTATNNLVSLYGYDALELRGDTYLKSNIDIDLNFARNNHIVCSANMANVGDELLEQGQWLKGIRHYGFAIGYGLETFLGPIEVKYAFSPEIGQDIWYVSAGFRF